MNKMIIGLIIAIVAGAVGYASYKWLGPDNPIEQACEEIIKDETGKTIDLSPDSADSAASPTTSPVDSTRVPTSSGTKIA